MSGLNISHHKYMDRTARRTRRTVMDSTCAVLVLLFLSKASAQLEQIGNNLVKNGSTYYTVIASQDSDYVCLMSSPNLVDWTRNRGIFDEFSAPLWAPSTMYKDPEIIMMDEDNVRVYFSAQDSKSATMAVSVAFSTKLEADRRYTTLNRPLAFNSSVSYVSPSLVLPNTTSTLPLLLYVGVEENTVYGGLLSKDALQVEDSAVPVLKPSLPWENGNITQAWGLVRFNLYYIFYTAGEEGVGVARSPFPLGPYTKRKEPFARLSKTPLARSTLMRNLTWEKGWPFLKL